KHLRGPMRSGRICPASQTIRAGLEVVVEPKREIQICLRAGNAAVSSVRAGHLCAGCVRIREMSDAIASVTESHRQTLWNLEGQRRAMVVLCVVLRPGIVFN